MEKNLSATRETQIWSLDQEDSLEKGMATHPSILAWRILWTEEPGGLQSIGSQRVRHEWAMNMFTFISFSFHFWNEKGGTGRDTARLVIRVNEIRRQWYLGRIRQAHLGARMEPSINKQTRNLHGYMFSQNRLHLQSTFKGWKPLLYITQEKNLKFVLNSNLHIEPVL